jgi:ligand-binding sensor domain-containing protein/anti-sigma regulatory factor (Ser/Thr protein kinase)
MFRYYFLLILLTCSAGYSYAQQQLMRHYTVNEGLPSNTVYSAFQDSRGFIWFCTNWGISRFDGHHFENITSKQGLPDNEIFDMKEDPWHRYWLLCYNGKPAYIFDGKVYSARNDALCRSIEKAGIKYHFFFYNKNNEFCLIGKQTYIVQKDRITTSAPDQTFRGTPLPFNCKGIDYVIDPDRILKRVGDRWDTLLEGSYICTAFYKEHLYGVLAKEALYGSGTKLFCDINFSGTKPLVKLIRSPYKILKFVPGKHEGIWCCTEAGIFAYDTAKNAIGPQQAVALSGIAVNHFFSDDQGNAWYLTAGDGVYMESPDAIKIYNHKTGLSQDNVLSVCYTQDDKLLAGYDNGIIDQIEDHKITSFKVNSSNFWNRIRYMLSINRDEFIAGTDAGLYRISRSSGKNIMMLNAPQKSGCLTGDNCLVGFNNWRHGGAALYNIHQDILNYLPFTPATCLVTATVIDDQQTCWMGTINGLYYYKGNTVHKWTGDSALSDKHITSLAVTKNGRLVISTPSDGLYILDKQKKILHFDESKGLISSLCSTARVDEQGRIWVCTDKGVDRITLLDGSDYAIHHLSTAEGVPTHIINDITFAKGKTYLATSRGIVIISQNQADLTVPSQVYILSLSCKDSLINYPRKVSLKYNQNNVVISYTCISYAGGNDISYRYLLRGSNSSDTIQTTQSTLNLGALKPGRYELMVWAAGKNNNWSKTSAVVYLNILPPFWGEIWFIALIILIVSILLVLIYKRRVAVVKHKEMEITSRRRRMAELEMQALRAQINPHFMFNALNAIQNYYSEHDERSANYYMSAFARLIRQTLNHSKEHWILLADEVAILKTYIELEQMRSKHSFSYNIELSPELEHKKIPTMLVQVYTENAINHGLRHLDGLHGKLRISFSRYEGNIVCKIEDNGVGFIRAKALDSRPGDHESMGMKITDGRIATINELYNTHITVNISDKNTLQGYGQGTIVTIIIPVNQRVI